MSTNAATIARDIVGCTAVGADGDTLRLSGDMSIRLREPSWVGEDGAPGQWVIHAADRQIRGATLTTREIYDDPEDSFEVIFELRDATGAAVATGTCSSTLAVVNLTVTKGSTVVFVKEISCAR